MTKTAEQVVAEAFTKIREPEYHISEEEDFSDACIAVAALREAGMLVETEWEVQYGRRNRETGALHWLTGDPRDDWWHENQDRYEHVKRYTSPPIPVEGEDNETKA